MNISSRQYTEVMCVFSLYTFHQLDSTCKYKRGFYVMKVTGHYTAKPVLDSGQQDNKKQRIWVLKHFKYHYAIMLVSCLFLIVCVFQLNKKNCQKHPKTVTLYTVSIQYLPICSIFC